MTRYLVTGGAGFIGSNLALALGRSGERVRVLDDLSFGRAENLTGAAGAENVELIVGSICDAQVVERAMSGIEVVFHHAAIGSVPLSIEEPVRADAVNVGGTVRVLEAARRAGARRVVFAASSAVYGDAPEQPKREPMTPRPLSPYAVSKLAGEHYLSVFSSLYGLETIGLRYFNIFGPGQRPDGAYAAAIPRFLSAALAGDPLTVFGDGAQTRDFCFVDNVVHANLLAAATPRRLTGEIVNIASGTTVVLSELIGAIGELLGERPVVRSEPPRRGDILHSSADISRARELIGYEPRVTWRAGLAPTAEFLRRLGGARGAS